MGPDIFDRMPELEEAATNGELLEQYGLELGEFWLWPVNDLPSFEQTARRAA